jgi:hypothetical protein
LADGVLAAWQMAWGRRTITLSGMEACPKGMLGFRLPPGYRVQMGPDVLVLRRADGLMVAAFVTPVADPNEVEREAAEDYWRSDEAAGRPPRSPCRRKPLVGLPGVGLGGVRAGLG